ncbi:MAG: FKBP-type peptidyl-prolyl cis-trans isomerase [Acidobacteriia bacterium]|nr:FKBP-type peptidyl-prolyl cis-trans isomerase [Terriglobia bacterium]
MPKPLIAVVSILAGVLLLGSTHVYAQQTPAATTQAAPSAKTHTPTAATKTATTAKSPVPLALKTQKDKFSYALGMNLGANLHRQSVPVDASILARGLRDALAGGKMLLTEDEARAALMAVQSEVRQKQQAEMQKIGDANKKEGEAFLAFNKTKEGVVELPSGLQYKILQAGTGAKPTATDSVVCNYRGMLIDGTEFDASSKHGGPATFHVTGVIKGWTEALQLMPVGSKWQLFVPSDLAYGERGMGGDIPPNKTLIFEVELVKIADKSQEKEQEQK